MSLEFIKTAAFAKMWPLLIGLGAATSYLAFLRTAEIPSSARELLPATLNIGAITVGFLATAKSIMFSLGDSPRLRALKAHGSYDAMVDYLLFAVHWSLILTALSAAGLLLNTKSEYVWLYAAAWLFVTLTALCSFYQVIRTLTSLLKAKDA